ncbi:hypothetical protein, partial [Nesterenkonia muleiensis]|uniref:hypothetical protein n=1 Tax=Nesterenkonia muleiensis TaxID=2282648 RepID=UPI001EE45D00
SPLGRVTAAITPEALVPAAGRPRSLPDVAHTDADASARVPDVAAPLGRVTAAITPEALVPAAVPCP